MHFGRAGASIARNFPLTTLIVFSVACYSYVVACGDKLIRTISLTLPRNTVQQASVEASTTSELTANPP